MRVKAWIAHDGAGEALAAGLRLEMAVARGLLVAGDADRLRALGPIKLLPDTHVLEIAGHRIEIDGPPAPLPAGLEVPPGELAGWRHHLLQLVAPPAWDWIAEIEQRGVHVVEKVSAYGLFVVGAAARVEALRRLPFVAWVGPFQPAYRLHPSLPGARGRLDVGVTVHSADQVADVTRALAAAGGELLAALAAPPGYGQDYCLLRARIDAARLAAIASRPGVRWIEPLERMGAHGGRETRAGVDDPGYRRWLAGVGLSGKGVTVAIVDTGVGGAPWRLVASVDYGRASGGAGHGAQVAGIAVGAPAETGGWQGVAPGAGYLAQNYLDGPQPAYPTLVQDSAQHGAQVMNASWGGSASSPGYTADTRQIDQLVRDAHHGAAPRESLVIVFAAGNNGGGPATITRPHESKNAIIVGSLASPRGMSGTSSRGPASDGRILPTLVGEGGATSQAAPRVSGAAALITEWWRGRTGGLTPSPALVKALLVNGAEDIGGEGAENWRCANGIDADRAAWTRHEGGVSRRPWPFPPAALVAGERPLARAASVDALAAGQWLHEDGVLHVRGEDPAAEGAPPLLARDAEPLGRVPSNDQGWGRVSLENMFLQAPSSARGPRLFSDERHAFTAGGQHHELRVAPVDPARPLRVTLVWTDAPGAAGASPALVNDLDLRVTETRTGSVYLGNVFAGGFSRPGGAFDALNNVECVYVEKPDGVYEVRVIAACVAANARPPFDATPWQDFALVLENAEPASPAPVSVVPVLGRPADAREAAALRAGCRAFIDLLGVDDALGAVSCAGEATIELPPRPVVGQATRDAALAAVDALAPGGASLGSAIQRARDLLAPVAGPRALVLFGDGRDAAALPPGDVPIHACALGPRADQALLEQLATGSGGRYSYAPSSDDLLEICNHLRAQVTGMGLIANEAAFADGGRVAAFVDAAAEQLTVSVTWEDEGLVAAAGDPRGPGELAVRLRDPRGRQLHPDTSWVRRILGKGHAVFVIDEPLAGQWHVELFGDSPARCTVGAFVRSPIRLVARVLPRRPRRQAPLIVSAEVLDGKRAVTAPRAHARFTTPAETLIAPLASLSREDQAALARATGQPLAPEALRGVVGARFFRTGEAGSYNVVVTATGLSPVSNTRYARKELVSVVVR